MNASRPPFDNPKVREAVNMLLNRQEIIDGALFGAGVPAGPLSPALVNWAVDPSTFACYTQIVEGAKALLTEAGVATPLKLTMNVLPRQDTRDIAQVVQQQLAAGGIEVELINQEIGQFVQDWRNSNFDMFVSANGGSPDPDEYFYRTFRGGGSTNVFKYDDAEIDGWLDKAVPIPIRRPARRSMTRSRQKLACDGPAAHLAYGTLFTAVNAKVQGFEIYVERPPDQPRQRHRRRVASSHRRSIVLRRLSFRTSIAAVHATALHAEPDRRSPGRAVRRLDHRLPDDPPHPRRRRRHHAGRQYRNHARAHRRTAAAASGSTSRSSSNTGTGSGARCSGDLGTSLWTGRPVAEEIVANIWPTIELTILVDPRRRRALRAARLLHGRSARQGRGSRRAHRRHRRAHHSLLLAGHRLDLPARQVRCPACRRSAMCRSPKTRWAISQRMVLPVIALSLPMLANLSRLVRSAMLDALGQDYIRTAKAKGAGRRRIIYKHALRNALIPFITSVGVSAGYLLGGAIVIEQVFAIPGLGRLVLGAIAERNYPLIQATILVMTAAFVIVNFIVDLLYAVIDPRVAPNDRRLCAATSC